MQHEEQHVRQLLRRFMSGETTLDEEREIAAWLRKTGDLPDDLRDYQQMFAYFDEGMPLPAQHPRRRSVYLRLRWLAAACVAALVGMAVWLWPAAEAPVVADVPVKTVTACPATAADSVRTDVIRRDSIRQPKPAVRRRQHRPLHSFPLPPSDYLAEAALDSLLWQTEMMADRLLAQTEQEQARLMDSLAVAYRQQELWAIVMSLEGAGEIIEE